MVGAGLAECEIAEQASTVALVAEKNDNLQICVEYSRLNAVIKQNIFRHLPVDVQFDILEKAETLLASDAVSDSWQT